MSHNPPFIPHHSRIGLLGGSFNPAHEGHLHLSIEAHRRLKLDQVVWLLSPQNPLKRKEDIAPYATRLAHAERLTTPYPFISVSDFERQNELFYSLQTVSVLQQCCPRADFVWLMGADNLASFHRWRGWQELFNRIPIAVFDRAPFSHAALRQKAALRFVHQRVPMRDAASLPGVSAPAWSYLYMPRHPQSGTALRKTLGESAFL